MTDLPTVGAVHFFNPLSTLSTKQQQQMKLYGVGMKEEIINHFFPRGPMFKDIFDIPSDKNPMVRAGFIDGNLDNSAKFHEPVSITLAGEKNAYAINKGEQIASIMLGSQASNDTVEYIESLFNNGMSKVFVFGGKTPVILEKINKILTKHPEYTDRIIPLGNQSDREIAPLMSRSNMVIIRGGGLSVMEQLSMKHNTEQTILIHHANSTKKDLTSGISWEDNNVKSLLVNLKERKVHSEKTSPQRAVRQIAEARLIAAVKRLGGTIDIDDATFFITKLTDKKLISCVQSLIQSEQVNSPSLPPELLTHFNDCDVLAGFHVGVLNDKLDKGKTHLTSIIIQEVAELMTKRNNSILDEHARYDVDAIVRLIDEPIFKDASLKLITTAHSYRAIEKLQTTLSINNEGSMSKKLTNFKNEYNQPVTNREFLATTGSAFIQIIKTIVFELGKYFPFITNKLSFEQDFSMFVKELKKHEDVPPVTPSFQPHG
jgi:effector protein SdbA